MLRYSAHFSHGLELAKRVEQYATTDSPYQSSVQHFKDFGQLIFFGFSTSSINVIGAQW
jgi:hypothetical protein